MTFIYSLFHLFYFLTLYSRILPVNLSSLILVALRGDGNSVLGQATDTVGHEQPLGKEAITEFS